ncbi:MAG TPA: L,D-transpeptidase family protein [Anaerolineaceae bacterium]|jgi:lipoprotein-anchoring transpeptidase ErfK/SrfK|nr:L,D-transpeptidase family protein [Anaerolineaceae bacterium]
MMKNWKISRREFLKMSGMVMGALALPKLEPRSQAVEQFIDGKLYGRIAVGDVGAWTEMRSEPNVDAPVVKTIYRDDVFEIKRELVANKLDPNRYKQRWYETPEGYVHSWMMQPCRSYYNPVVNALPEQVDGQHGMWVEITIPKVDIQVQGSKENSSYWIRSVPQPRLYYSQVHWVSDIRQHNGRTEYLLSEKYGALPDQYWVDARACRVITPEEIAPIHPEAGEKRIVVDLYNQTLYAFEGKREVYFCEVSTGYVKEGKWTTTPGVHHTWRKMISLHMSAGGVSQYDSPGIAWTLLYHSDGQAIHTAYWHNNFGVALSHGCVNCLPHDAKWIWRWSEPYVGYYPGEQTIQGFVGNTTVEVIE